MRTPLHIGIDARFYGPTAKGLGRYTAELIRYLGVVDQTNRYSIFLRDEQFRSFVPPSDRFKPIRAELPWYSLAEQIQMPRLVRAAEVDLMHYPHFNVPLLAPKPFVVTIHDLIISHFPTVRASTLGPLLYAIKHWGFNRVINHAVHASEHVITVSEFSKQDIQKTFKIPNTSISVTYESVHNGHHIYPPVDISRWGITKPFLLYIGNAYPHKNLERLLEAFLDPSLRDHLQLVLVGKKDYFYERIENEAKRLGFMIGQEVLFPGFVSDEHLDSFFRKAAVYVFPSLYEGFGLPPLEALARNCPVVSSNATCMPEILKDCAIYFSPESIDEMRRAIHVVVDDQKTREALLKKAPALVASYSWEKMAQETLQIYSSVR